MKNIYEVAQALQVRRIQCFCVHGRSWKIADRSSEKNTNWRTTEISKRINAFNCSDQSDWTRHSQSKGFAPAIWVLCFQTSAGEVFPALAFCIFFACLNLAHPSLHSKCSGIMSPSQIESPGHFWGRQWERVGFLGQDLIKTLALSKLAYRNPALRDVSEVMRLWISANDPQHPSKYTYIQPWHVIQSLHLMLLEP